MGTSDPWRMVKTNSDDQTMTMTMTLKLALLRYPHISFDHAVVGHLDRNVCVFIVKGEQEAVLYDKTEGFPSDKLMASLVLLGS